MHHICCIIEIHYRMNYLEFRNQMFETACFNINQVYAWQPDFDRNNFVRWTRKGLLIRLRQGYYTFPELLFDLGLTGHRDERFLIKIESQDQQNPYSPVLANIKGCGFFFAFPVPSDEVLCAMKLSAMLSRSEGRDFYDAMFLLAQSKPDYGFLAAQQGIHNLNELKSATADVVKNIDLKRKQLDFEHLLFNKTNSNRILHFNEFIQELKQ